MYCIKDLKISNSTNYNKNNLRKTQEIYNLEISLDNEEFKIYNFIAISGKGNPTIRIGKMISYE